MTNDMIPFPVKKQKNKTLYECSHLTKLDTSVLVQKNVQDCHSTLNELPFDETEHLETVLVLQSYESRC